MFASKSNRGFYDAEIHGAGLIPDDAIEISAEYHAELLAGESGGKIITWRDDGFPVLADPPPPSDEALAAVERVWRDQRLLETDGVVARHRDEQEAHGHQVLADDAQAGDRRERVLRNRHPAID